MTSNHVQTIVATATAKARELGAGFSIAIVDAGGHLRHFERMDGAFLGSIDVAISKARTAVLFERETQDLWQAARPDGEAHGIELTNGTLVTFAGGIPLMGTDGALLGAIGVSGGRVAEDYDVARAGCVAVASVRMPWPDPQ